MVRTISLALGALILTGCSGKTITRYETDRLTGDPIEIVTERKSFWQSENLDTHYRFEIERTRYAAESARLQIHAIQNEATRTAPLLETPTERALHGILPQMQVAMVQTTPGPSGIQAPKTMTDFWGVNLIPLMSVGLQAYQVFGGNWGDSWSQQTATDSPEIAVTGSGNNVFFKSDHNQNPAYSLSAVGHGRNAFTAPGIGGYTIDETHTRIDERGDSSYGLSLF